MAWSVEGQYFENCSCDTPCPCTVSLSLGADRDYCHAVLMFHVDSGEVEGVDVSGLDVAAVLDTPKHMHEGNWRLGLLIDDGASDEQADALARVFGGEMGGPMQALAPLVTEQLGVQRTPMEFSSEGGSYTMRMGDVGTIAVEEVVPFGVESGEPARLTAIAHPMGTELTIAQATESRFEAFGVELANVGGSGFSNRFAWSG